VLASSLLGKLRVGSSLITYLPRIICKESNILSTVLLY
jgi:hypothetical protein